MSFRDWIELESDPGLFTLLLFDFGVNDVEVEEVYDLSKPIKRCVYGFIFLFKWTEERKSRRKAVVPEENFVCDEDVVTNMFFAQQIIPNSCASHALLSVLLNIPDVTLGYTLKQLRDSCKGFDAEMKGHAIGNFWNIGVAHNNHGRPELRWQADRIKNVAAASRSMEAFHYVSYIPYKGNLFELDGLKPHPINHGPWLSDETWSDKARRVIQERIQLATGGELSHDIRYNLMAVVPENRNVYKLKMDILHHNKRVLIELFKTLATKDSFLSEAHATGILKPNYSDHPFRRSEERRSRKKVSFGMGERSNSPFSSCSSTLTGTESPSHLFSDSEDSYVDTYRVKSIMRETMKGHVYVYGEREDNCTSPQDINNDNAKETNKHKIESDSTNTNDPKKMKLTNSTNESNNLKSTVVLSEKIDNVSEKTADTAESSENVADEIDKESEEIELKRDNVSESIEKLDEEDNKPGLGVEIIADDADIESLLDQTKIGKLSLEHLLKYQDKIKLHDLQKCMQDLDEIYKSCQTSHKEELEKIEKYKIDDCRRRHNYDPFISTFLTMLAEQGHLTKLLEQQNTVLKRVSSNAWLKKGKKKGNLKNK